MEIMEIITDALHYPLDHLKALGIYILLSFLALFILLITVGASILGSEGNASLGIIGVIGVVITIVIGFLVEGFGLDIVKYGIEQSDAEPEIDLGRQVVNGIKLMITGAIYFIIPFIIMLILGYINQTLGTIIGIILLIIFALAFIMGECRLAETESMGYALNIPEAIQDIKDVGIVKILAVIIIMGIIIVILNAIVGLFGNFGDIGTLISAILGALVSGYTSVFSFRATGLLYSDK